MKKVLLVLAMIIATFSCSKSEDSLYNRQVNNYHFKQRSDEVARWSKKLGGVGMKGFVTDKNGRSLWLYDENGGSYPKEGEYSFDIDTKRAYFWHSTFVYDKRNGKIKNLYFRKRFGGENPDDYKFLKLAIESMLVTYAKLEGY